MHREGVAYLAREGYGYTGWAMADLLHVRSPAVYRAARRGRTHRAQWNGLLMDAWSEKNSRKQRPV